MLCQGHTYLTSDPGSVSSYVGVKQENMAKQLLLDNQSEKKKQYPHVK